MLKKHFVLFSFLIFPILTAAETCPDINSIKAGQFNGWQALDANSDSPVTTQRVHEFKKKVKEFYQAEWSEDFIGHGHCYYTGDLETLLAKETIKPKESKSWHDTGLLLRCKSGLVQDCEF